MRPRIAYLLLSLLILFLAGGCSTFDSSNTAAQPGSGKGSGLSYSISSLAHIHLPPGFQISVYASGLHTPRFMTMGPNGVLLVADPGSNSIIALPPGTSTGHAGTPMVIARNLNSPTSLVMQDGYLYVSEASSIARMALGDDLKAGPLQRIITNLPGGGPYSTPTVLIGPDNQLYVSISSDCNICIEKDPHRAAVWVYDMDGSHGRLFAKGLPNAAGMAVNPWMGQIWANVNESNLPGNATLPEALYGVIDQGDYGWPRCHAGTIRDPQFGQSPNACKGVQKPLITMQAHSAPMGLAFYPRQSTQFPASYTNSLYIALHGSGNSGIPTGYKVVRIPLDCGKMPGPVEDFITGWLNSDGTSSGRPIGITFAPDGSMFISDDQAGLIYHVWYYA